MTAAVLVAVIAVPATAQQDPGVVGIELVDHPDQHGMGRRGLVSIVAEAEPGAVVEREVLVTNQSTAAQHLEIYVDDATVDEAGFTPADGRGDISGWASVAPGTVELAPGDQQRAVVRIQVPEEVTDGERYGAVWVELPASSGDVRRVNRVGVRIYLTVVGGSQADPEDVTDFVITAMTADTLPDGSRQIRASVTNTGRRAVDLVGELELLDGPGGLRAGPFPTDAVTTVAIGLDATVTITMSPEVPRGPWNARLQLASGAIERAAEATVGFPAAPGDAPDQAVAEMTSVERQRRVLIPIASTMVATMLAVALVLLLGRRREATGGAASEAGHKTSVGV